MLALGCQPLASAKFPQFLRRAIPARGTSVRLPCHQLVRGPRTGGSGSSSPLPCTSWHHQQHPQEQQQQQQGLSALRRTLPGEQALRGVRLAMGDALTSRAPHSYEGLLFRQLFESSSSTYTYILADASNKACPGVIIDPVEETAERDAQVLRELGVTLLYALNTHVHADHITGTAKLKASFPEMQTVISEVSGAKADRRVRHGDYLHFGSFSLEVRSTPGHTAGCVTYVLRRLLPTGSDMDSPSPSPQLAMVVPVVSVTSACRSRAGEAEEGGDETLVGGASELMAFTGDALLIRGCGRTDFQGGDPRLLYQSVHSQILSLLPETLLYPAHDYKGRTVTTVAEELRFNPRLTKTEDEFTTIMDNLGLPYPKQMNRAVPANMVCGFHENP